MPAKAPAAPPARPAWWFGALAALALLAAVVASELLEWRYLQRPLLSVLQHTTGATVRLEGDFRLQLLRGPLLRVQHLSLPSVQFPGLEHLVDATDVRLRWRWLDLWRFAFGGTLRLHSLEVATLDAQLIRDTQGHTSWAMADNASGAALPSFGRLYIEQGNIRWTDAALATHIDFVVRSDAAGPQSGYRAKATGLVRSLPLDLDIVVGGALPLLRQGGTDRQDAALPVRVDGKVGRSVLHFDGTAAALFGAQQLAGDFTFAGPSLAAVGDPLRLTLPRTPPFVLAGRIEHDAGVWTLATPQLHVGRSRLAGDFRFDTRAAIPHLSGQLRGPLLQLADLGPAVGAAGEGGSNGSAQPAAARRILPTRQFDLPSLRDMNADVAVAIDTFDFGSPRIAPMLQLRTQLKLQDGRLQLEGLHAELAGGHVSGSSALDGTADTARWQADLRFDGIDIARWLRALQSKPGPAAPAYLTGELIARLKASGNGRSTAEILASLDGQAQLRLRNGTVSHLAVEAVGLDAAQALGVMVRGDRPLPMNCAVVALQLHKGVLTSQRAVVDTSDSTLHGAGHIDLNDETLALRLTVKPKDFSLFSLRAPVTITGTLAQPVVGVEGQALAGRALAAAALAVVAPPAALLAFLDFGDASTTNPCTQPAR